MSILDTFYLLFKTDIPTGVKKEVEDLDKQIDKLNAKGKKRSEEENKEYKELQKRRKEALQDLKDQEKEVDKISDSFIGLIRNGLSAITAFASFQGIKSGILDAAQLNSNLEIQAKITGENVHELRAYSAAVESAGGSSEGFLQTLNSMAAAAAENGVSFEHVGKLLDRYHEAIQGLPKQEQRRILALGGITDPGTISLLEKSNSEYKKAIDLQKGLTSATEDDYEKARLFEEARANAIHSLTSAFTRLGSDVLPTVAGQLERFDGYVKDLEKEKGGVETFFVETAAFAIGAWTPVGRLVAGIIFLLAQLPNIPKIPKAIGEGAEGTAYKVLKSVFTGTNAFAKNGGAPVIPSSGSGEQVSDKKALDFWISQGYTKEEAEYIVKLRGASSEAKEIRNDAGGSVPSVPSIPPSGGAGIGGGGGGGQLNVKIDNIKLYTQADDAVGISKDFSEALKNELHLTFSDWDDAQDR